MYLDRSTALNNATIKKLIINHLVKLYRDTRNTQQTCTRTAKTTPYPPCLAIQTTVLNTVFNTVFNTLARLRRVTLTKLYRRAVSCKPE